MHRPVNNLFVRRDKLSARKSHAIERSRENKAFDEPFVQNLHIGALHEVLETRKRSVPLPFLDYRVDRAKSYTLYRGKSVTYLRAVGGKKPFAFVDIGRQNGYAFFAGVGYVVADFLDVGDSVVKDGG